MLVRGWQIVLDVLCRSGRLKRNPHILQHECCFRCVSFFLPRPAQRTSFLLVLGFSPLNPTTHARRIGSEAFDGIVRPRTVISRPGEVASDELLGRWGLMSLVWYRTFPYSTLERQKRPVTMQVQVNSS